MKRMLKSARAVPPGRIIRRELESRGWTQKELAEIMGRPASKISPIIRGTKGITPRTALELAEAFGTSADVWVNLEARYRLSLAERTVAREAIARRAFLFQVLPVSEIVKRGWITDSHDLDELEASICTLLGVDSREEIPTLAASFRGSKAEEANTAALLAWCHRAKQAVEKQEVGSFSLNRFRQQAVAGVLQLADSTEKLDKIQEVLAECGVRFIILPHLSRTYLDGAAFEVNSQPAIALTLRYDRIDSFWFTLMHELAHIYAGHEGEFLDRDVELSNGSHEETEANSLAAEWLLPAKSFKAFVARSRPYFSRARIEEFSVGIGRHPGIVLGRLHKEGEVPYKNLRPLLISVSGHLAQSMAT